MSYQEVDTFNIIVGGEIQEELEGRANAVARAKELSSEGQRVNVERTDNMVTMQFADGSLETYVCETRDRKPRRRDRGDENEQFASQEEGEERVSEIESVENADAESIDEE